MTPSELRTWVKAWAATYHYSDGEDRFVARFTGRPRMDRAAMNEIVGWKFAGGRYLYQANAVRRLASESDERIEDLTGRAFSCNDDLGALLLICELSGPGPALASAILMVNDPVRYTVIDTRALRSLRNLDRLGPGIASASSHQWLDYLTACRLLRDISGESLRTVDKALFMAKGKSELPPTIR